MGPPGAKGPVVNIPKTIVEMGTSPVGPGLSRMPRVSPLPRVNASGSRAKGPLSSCTGSASAERLKSLVHNRDSDEMMSAKA